MEKRMNKATKLIHLINKGPTIKGVDTSTSRIDVQEFDDALDEDKIDDLATGIEMLFNDEFEVSRLKARGSDVLDIEFEDGSSVGKVTITGNKAKVTGIGKQFSKEQKEIEKLLKEKGFK